MHRSTFSPLQDANPTPSFGGFGLSIRWLLALSVLAIAVVLSACIDSPPPTPEPTATATATPSPEPTATATPEPARPTSVTVSPATVDLTALGTTTQLRAEVRDQDSTVMTGVTVTWTTSANSVATVDAVGVVTGAGNGTATITASAGSASGAAVVTVTQTVASVEVSPSVAELTAWGETVQLTAEALDANGHAVAGAVLSWESTDVPVATVDAAGVVTGAGNGTATITASAGSASGAAVVTVTQTVASVKVLPSVAELTAWGETVQLTAEALDANGHAVAGAVLSWESTDVPVATVDAAGVVTGAGNGTATITASAGSASGAAVVTVTQTVASVKVSSSMADLTAWGETVQLTAEALDANGHAVAGAAFSCESSDPWVASVPEGTVTAVGGGNATVTAAYDGLTVDTPISVRISTRSTGAVRVLYAIPSDREFRASSSETIAHFIVDLQSWYRRELGGLTFSVYEVIPEVCRMSGTADSHARGNAWENVVAGVQHCGSVQHDHPDFVWVVYVDLMEPCDESHELGAGGAGLTIMTDGRTGFIEDWYYYCGEGPYDSTVEGWIVGLGHELGHTLGLPHPPGCEEDLPTCDRRALMWDPVSPAETYLRADNKEVLIRSPFIGTEPVPGRDPDDVANASSVSGGAFGPGDEPLQGVRVSLVGEDFWSWGETGEDGAFVIPVPDGSSGPSVLSIHAGGAGECGWLGYHGPDGITTARTQATRVEIADGNVTGIEIRLPVKPESTDAMRPWRWNKG